MGTMLGLLGLMLGAWAVRTICMKPPNDFRKVLKSVLAAAWFLGAGGLGGTQEKLFPLSLAMLLLGAALVFWLDRRNRQSSR